MSPLSAPPLLDRRGGAVMFGSQMHTATRTATPAAAEKPLQPREMGLIQADESTYTHGGEGWTTVVRSCRIRLGVAGLVFVGFTQAGDLLSLVAGYW